MQALRWIAANWQIPVEILLIAVVIYYILKTLQGGRGVGLLRGIFILFTLVYITLSLLARYSDMYRLTYLLNQFLGLFAFVLIIVFAPELRRGLMRIGQRPLFSTVFRREAAVIAEVVAAARHMSERRIGALIAFEREVGLRNYAETGTAVDSEVTAALLNTIFWPGGPLHDGAVIISQAKIAAAACILPNTEREELGYVLGTRHRAAIGLTEVSDALVIVVSEETRAVSLAHDGEIRRGLSIEDLTTELNRVLLKSGAGRHPRRSPSRKPTPA